MTAFKSIQQLSIYFIAAFLFSCNKSSEVKVITELSTSEIQSVCASTEMLENDIQSDPSRRIFLDKLEEKTAAYENIEINNRLPGKLYLPVVIHIVMTDPAVITDAAVISQLQVWNKDFNKMNDELSNSAVYLAGYDMNKVANCDIEFTLPMW